MRIILGLAALICFAVAGLLSYQEKCGWGWFVIAGLLVVICLTG